MNVTQTATPQASSSSSSQKIVLAGVITGGMYALVIYKNPGQHFMATAIALFSFVMMLGAGGQRQEPIRGRDLL
jgi:DNA gyrase inhibitor GyrI